MLLFYWKVSASQCKPMSSKRRQLLPRNTHASSLPNYSEQESDDQNTTENVHQPKRTRENLRIVITKTADGNWGKGRPWNKWATHCKFSLQNSNGRWAFSPGRHASSTLSASHSVLWRHRLRAVCFKSLSLTKFQDKDSFFYGLYHLCLDNETWLSSVLLQKGSLFSHFCLISHFHACV